MFVYHTCRLSLCKFIIVWSGNDSCTHVKLIKCALCEAWPFFFYDSQLTFYFKDSQMHLFTSENHFFKVCLTFTLAHRSSPSCNGSSCRII